MKINIDCKEASRLISTDMDVELAPADSNRLRLHFVMCKTCRTVAEQMKFLRRTIRKFDKGEPMG